MSTASYTDSELGFPHEGGGTVAKTLIDIDEDLLEAARSVLGTSTEEDTVNIALREVLAMQRRANAVEGLVEWLGRNESWDDSVRDRAWRHP